MNAIINLKFALRRHDMGGQSGDRGVGRVSVEVDNGDFGHTLPVAWNNRYWVFSNLNIVRSDEQ